MAEDRVNGSRAYGIICEALDGMGWNYDKHPEDNVVTFGVRGEDIPMQFVVCDDTERQLIRILSQLPFVFPEDKRLAGAHAVCRANFEMAVGCFEYDADSGSVNYKLVTSYRDSLITSSMIVYLIRTACEFLDEYNDKFLAVCKGYIKPEAMADGS